MEQKPGLKYYKDKRGKTRWRLVGKNNEIVAASSQGFSSRRKANQNVELVIRGLPHWRT